MYHLRWNLFLGKTCAWLRYTVKEIVVIFKTIAFFLPEFGRRAEKVQFWIIIESYISEKQYVDLSDTLFAFDTAELLCCVWLKSSISSWQRNI